MMLDLDSDDEQHQTYPGVVNTVPEFTLSDDSRRVIKGILESKTAETHGILNIDELGECLDAFGFTFDDEDVDFLKKHFDDNGDGELEVEELVNNIDVLNWHSLYGKRLMKEFKKIDFDRDGVIRYPEMLKVLTTRGPNPLPPKDARRLLDQLARKFDANFDGKFSYAEFVKIYMSDMLPYRNTIVDNNASSSDEEQPVARAQKDLRKRPSGLKKRQTASNLNGAARGAAASSSLSSTSASVRATSFAPSAGRGGSTYARPAPPQSGRRRPTHQSSVGEDYPREGSSRPRSVWERLSQTKTPLQKRSTYH